MFCLTQCSIFPSGLNQLVKLAVVEVVERKQCDQKVMDSNPAEQSCWPFFLSTFFSFCFSSVSCP